MSRLIANNAEIDVIWGRMQPAVEDALADLGAALAGHPTPFAVTTGGRAGQRIDFAASGTVTLPSGEPAPANGLMEWEVPREAPPDNETTDWPAPAREALARFWQARIARQREIDASIAAKAEHEYLYDKPYEDRRRIRVAGPFTVLFVVFGEPDIKLVEDGESYRVELRGVDIFRPATGQVESSDADDIACWFIDTDYSGESFFVRHAYFPGAEIPYKALRSTLKAEIDEDAWDSLKRTVSRPFPRPKSGRIAVKVINHLGDEVMKVMGV